MPSSKSQPGSEAQDHSRVNRGQLLALIGILGTLAIVVIVLRMLHPIVNGVNEIRDGVLLTVGLGAIPMAAWVAGGGGNADCQAPMARKLHRLACRRAPDYRSDWRARILQAAGRNTGMVLSLRARHARRSGR